MSPYANELRRFEYTDVLGGSYSRCDTFKQCKRMYFYQF